MSTMLIKNGSVYNPSTGEIRERAIAIDGALISESKDQDYAITIDAEGCIVSPGLIDYHIHVFEKGTLSGVNVDLACLPNGVTYCVDGGSAGCGNYEMFHSHTIKNAATTVQAMLNVASAGLITAAVAEELRPQYIETQQIKQVFSKHPEELVALKIRASKGVMEPNDSAIKAAIELAQDIGCRVVVHMTNPALPSEAVARLLRPGDVFCHMYQSIGDTIVGQDGKVKKAIWEAREKGVLFDACNGRTNFGFRVANAAVSQGFLPDIISSDINECCYYLQPVISLPRILSKYLAMGVELDKVLSMATINPARCLGIEKTHAALSVGNAADIAIFKLIRKSLVFKDCHGDSIKGSVVLNPQMTIKDGKVVFAQTDFQ